MADASPSTSATPGISPPLGVISAMNQSGLIAIMTSLTLTFVLVSLLIRIYVRVKIGPWKIDDHVLAAATAFSCVQSALVFVQIGLGLGKVTKLISTAHLAQIHKFSFTNNILYIIILFLSKCSVGFLYGRLTPARGHKIALGTILGGSAVWTIMSILLISIDCSWETSCQNMFARWMAIGVVDIITEAALFLMSIYLVKDLQMSWKPKTIVVAAFGARILVVPACALRLYYLNPSTLSTTRTMADTLTIICTQLQIGCGIMAATVPCLKPFVAVYEQPNGDVSNTYFDPYSGDKYKLSSVNSDSRHRRSNTTGENLHSNNQVPSFRPDHPTYTATVSFRDRKKGSSSSIISHSSRQMIIEQTTDWSVKYENRSLQDEGRSDTVTPD